MRIAAPLHVHVTIGESLLAAAIVGTVSGALDMAAASSHHAIGSRGTGDTINNYSTANVTLYPCDLVHRYSISRNEWLDDGLTAEQKKRESGRL